MPVNSAFMSVDLRPYIYRQWVNKYAVDEDLVLVVLALMCNLLVKYNIKVETALSKLTIFVINSSNY